MWRGSALPKEGEKISGWIRKALRQRPTPDQLRNIVDERLQGMVLRPFQEALGKTTARVVLAQAGCGSGKTLGGYVWAAQRAPGKRLFFSYPTTGTATEGFRDYLIDPTLNAQLVHSRAAVDLELLGVDDCGEQAAPLAALETWSTSIISCTVDTVLGLIQNQRRWTVRLAGIRLCGVRFRRNPRLRRAIVFKPAAFPVELPRRAVPPDDGEFATIAV